jgi:hypothetical protein
MATRRRETTTNKAKIALGKILPEALDVIIASMRDGDIQAANMLLTLSISKPRSESTPHRLANIKKEATVNDIASQLVSDMAAGDIPATVAESSVNVLLKSQELILKTNFMAEIEELKAQLNELRERTE